MKGLTFSGLGRAVVCPPSAAYPQTHRTTAEAVAGSAKHGFLENVPKVGRDEALALVPPEHRQACDDLDLSPLPASKPGRYAFELALAYNVDTGTARVLGLGLNREYHRAAEPPTEREICGTLDVVGVLDDAVIVADYKSGFGQYVTRPRDNWQLRIGALAAARAFDKDRAHVALIHLQDGDPRWERAALSVVDLDATELAIRSVVARVERARELIAAGQQPDLYVGEHCKYCPALTSCPAQMGLIAAAIGKQLLPDVLNEKTAPDAYAALKAVEVGLERAWASLNDFSDLRPIDLGGGYVYGRVKVPETVIDPEKAPPVIASILGTAPEPKVKKIITKEQVKDLVRAKKLPIGKTTDQVIAALKDAGAAHVVFENQRRKHKPKPPAIPAENPPPHTEEHQTNAAHDQDH